MEFKKVEEMGKIIFKLKYGLFLVTEQANEPEASLNEEKIF